ncbi:transcriptional regulator [Bradyrhizobium tropiciagri]|uniref:transcriptional regulator n=1 Tax=Bradyrhizobium tropiciagri TaxID=312253 RepID=UPI001BA83D3D|nr:transcriptional regulator [Bradyrhizobium tropiciagri]MBR0872525.1 transcriptional regulator [Bradyrhizobium tropiciagri]
MDGKKVLSPTSVARAERQRVAAEEGARAMAEIDREAVAVRKNMERLRLLREAKQAADAGAQADAPDVKKKRTKTV